MRKRIIKVNPSSQRGLVKFSFISNLLPQITRLVFSLCFLLHIVKNADSVPLEGKCPEVCTTRQCVVAASKMLERMNLDADPCEDFFKFACGKYPQDSHLFSTGMSVYVFREALETLYSHLIDMMNNITTEYMEEFPNSISTKSKVIYDSCVESIRTKDIRLEKLRNFISTKVIPGWPELKPESDLTEDDLSSWIANMLTIQQFAFYRIDLEYVTEDIFKEYLEKYQMTFPPTLDTGIMIKVDVQGSFMLSTCDGDENIKHFKIFFKQMLQSLDLSEQESNDIINDAIAFEAEWQFFCNTEFNSTERSILCTEESHRQLSQWCDLLFRVLELTGGNVTLSTAKITVGERVHDIPEFLSKQPKKRLANYFAVRLMQTTLNVFEYVTGMKVPCRNLFLVEDMRDASDLRFHCFVWMNEVAPTMLAKDYIESFNLQEKMVHMTQILEHIKKVGLTLANNSEWMSDVTKNQISLTISRTRIDTSDFVSEVMLDKLHLELRFSDMKPKENDFIHNYFEMLRTRYVQEIKYYYLGRQYLDMRAFAMNARASQVMFVGMGYFEYPIADFGRPRYLDYAMQGYMLGHELIHNLQDIYGDELDKDENELRTISDYRNCLIEAYSHLYKPELSNAVTGAKFVENMPDVLGFHLTFETYRDYLKEHGPEPRLPGPIFTNEQAFLISASQMWCEYGDFNTFEEYDYSDHSPGKVRILGPLMQKEKFSEVFNCPKGSYMNNVTQCKPLV